MKFRIKEYKPGRYHAQRRYIFVWKTVVKASFVTVADTEKAIRVYIGQLKKRYEEWHFRPRVVKVI